MVISTTLPKKAKGKNMKMRHLILGMLVLGLTVLNQVGAQQTLVNGGTQPMVTHQTLDAKYSAITEDANTVGSFVDDLLNFSHPYHVDSQVKPLIKDRLAQAEINYRHGANPGVEEADVVTAINRLSDRFHVPEYGKTSLKQVKYMRLSLAILSPQFMGAGMSTPEGGQPINSKMSPLQALHLATMLIDQKLVNPMYQVTPADWDGSIHLQPVKPAGPTQAKLVAHDSRKMNEMFNILRPGFEAIRTTDAISLMHETFTTLGISG
jgi:hypothetical protein